MLILAETSGLSDTYPRQAGIDVQHYVFRVSLNDDNDEIRGEAKMDVRFIADGVTEIRLDLASPTEGMGMTVSEVTSQGTDVPYVHYNNHLILALSTTPKHGDHRQFTIEYHGIAADGLHISRNKFGERTFFSNNWPDLARQWLPTIDHPYDKATSEFLITAPNKYQVVANGVLIEETDLGDGMRLTHWKQSEPIATWLNNIGVARFASRHFGEAMGIPLDTWVFPKDRQAGVMTFEEPMRQAFAFYSDRIGPYPYDKLAAVQATGFAGGMENASAIFYGEKAVDGRPAFRLVWHEVAHQWFGDSITEKDWDDVWLSEGFATYFTLLAEEHYDGRDAFVSGLKDSRMRVFEAEKKLPGIAVYQDKPWKGIPNVIVYQKGGWALHMLRGQLGTGQFWAGIREYYRRYRDSNASTVDFESALEKTSGVDLGWFFHQWIYRAGSPTVKGGWRYSSGLKKITIELAQTQSAEAYRLPLEVGIISDGSAVRIERIELNERVQRFEIPADREPETVSMDPNTWMLVDFHFEKFVR